MTDQLTQINDKVRAASEFVDPLIREVSQVIVGQRPMIERLLMSFLCHGHILMEGVPGLAKTTAVKAIAAAVNTGFKRIQFTPDLLPADLIGTLIYNPQSGDFVTKKGPIFTNIVLADEINRAPSKVQSALLEAMQERQVTIGDRTYPLEDPFLVLATQNPIEQEGTYPLPEAQVDRFMFKIKIDYPTKIEEAQIVARVLEGATSSTKLIKPIIEPGTLREARSVVNQVYMDEKVKNYILDLVFATRDPKASGLPDLAPLISFGASPRASIALSLAAKANAFLRHRGYITPDDVKVVAPDVLRHRVLLTYEAEAEEMTSDDIIKKIIDSVEVP